MTERESPWMTAEEAAVYLDYSGSSIRRFAREGRLEHRRRGYRGDFRFKVEWLDEFRRKENFVIQRPPKPIIQRPRRTPTCEMSKHEKRITDWIRRKAESERL